MAALSPDRVVRQSSAPEVVRTVTPTSVLLVDDSSAFLRVATQFLQAHAELLVVGQVLGGKEALAQAEALRPDVVLVDLAMPDLPGLALIPRLRAAQPEMGIIALTLLDADGYRQAALAAGADEFVAKAALGTDLLPAIRRVARARRSIEGPQREGDAAAQR